MRPTSYAAAAPILMALAIALMALGAVRAETAIPDIKKDTPYTEAREALVRQGWTPVPQSPTYCEGGQCGFARCIDGFENRCKLWPEALKCRGTGFSACDFLWRKDGTDIVVHTIGELDPPSLVNIRIAKKPVPTEPLPYSQPTIQPPTQGGLPFCKAGDDQIPVPSWTPELNEKAELTAPPPIGDGRVVFIAFDVYCKDIDYKSDKDGPYYFDLPDDPNDRESGGLVVNLRGQLEYAAGQCYFRGFYMNTLSAGIQHGWVATLFRPVDRFELIASNRFCAVKDDAP